ncbi:FKBP-type peptidyl-prolyl cis-trans isomerase [Maioricimonas sp. JC845]|uniref:FKBP-type peptidyl-prolyl cis-trans isomerase n=1 Tax=Maioricimonas sp. JC845 TaxID=3232138 RepID=UPI003457FE22
MFRSTRIAGCGLMGLMTLASCTNSQMADKTPAVPTAAAVEEASAEADAEPATENAGEFKTTDSGLKYRILKKGTGTMPTSADTVKCHYRGWLDDGTEFDSSYKRGEPTTFPLGGVIPGWTEGLQLVGEGGKIELEIPSELGYGQRGAPPVIPPGATLHFEVELIEVL